MEIDVTIIPYITNNAKVFALLFLLAAAFPAALFAQEDEGYIEDVPDSSEIARMENSLLQFTLDGLVVDETQTKIGQDFYDLFYSTWDPPEDVYDYTITISEKPLPQLGTQLTVTIDDFVVFQQVIQPRYEIIELMALYAQDFSYQYLANYEDIQKQLQGEDLQGTGLY